MSREHHYRFFVHPENIIGDIFVNENKDLINQVRKVFRLKKGGTISVLDNSGYEYQVQIEELGKNMIQGKVIEKMLNKTNNNRKIVLYMPLLKGKNIDLILEKCTEIGVDAFCPILYQNSVIKASGVKERWKSIVREASEQCGRNTLPQIKDPQNLKNIFDAVSKDINIVCEGPLSPSISELKFNKDKNINIYIGPEGGFSDHELDLMHKNSFFFCSLNQNVLRAETACIVSLGYLVNMW
ncbi:MAG TPA: RsmE family RNA methyltransferase [Patescibacteria group bacterium]|nr:RsmE family RNA methyltransferase [Patescibacteria group bacterium]